MIEKPIYVVDWDGTLIEDGHYPEMGKWLPGAVEALHELLEHGEVLIYTMRVSPYEQYHDGDEAYRRPGDDIDFQLSSIYDMLDAKGLYEVKVHTTKGKPAGTFYIDNQAIEFRGSWGEVLDRVLAGREQPAKSDAPVVTGEDKAVSRPASIRPVSEESDTIKDSAGNIRQFPSGATRDTAETAWAAGLFEGEGWISFDRNLPILGLRTTDLDVLERFYDCIGRIGSVNGPYHHKRSKPGKPFWQWFASSKKAREVIPLLFPYLGKRRQSKAIEAFGDVFDA